MRLSVVDSIRGLLLVQMTLDHLGRPFNYWFFQCLGFFSAAEGFFFLSGLVGGWAVLRKMEKDPGASFLRRRAFTLWKAQVGTVTLFALFVWLSGIHPPYGFAVFMEKPLASIVLTLALLHTPGWFDVLSLYAWLLLAGSWLLPRMARGAWWPLAVSALLWLLAQLGLRAWTRSLLPSWSGPGTFDPFAWQLVYFLGATAALHGPKLAARLKAAWPTWKNSSLWAAGLVALALWVWSRRWLPLPAPAEILVSREGLGFLRVIDFLLVASLVAQLARRCPSALDFRATALLGRHSLPIFMWQSLLVQFWFLMPKPWHQPPLDALGSLLALSTLWIVALGDSVRKGQKK